MRTSSFFTYQGPGRITIARYAPRGTPGGFHMFKALAPGGWFNKVGFAQYEKLYREEILGRLDARRTFDELVALADGAEPVLLCWEKPPLTQTNCTRSRLADWTDGSPSRP